MTATQYSGITTITPAMTRVEARYVTLRMPMTSSASISSLIRIAPSWAVAPAPMVADSATAVVPGTMSRTLKNADAKPVSASNPTDANWLYPPCTATKAPPVVMVRKPTIATVPPTTASAPAPKPICAMSR